MTIPAILSGFMNNTPVVALMVPAVRTWAHKHQLSISKILMPMNDAVVLGGLCTLIGTSTNIVVSGFIPICGVGPCKLEALDLKI